jgi:phosphohistidine phosphatase
MARSAPTRLILLRHGIAEPRSAENAADDALRALTPRGAARVRKAARGLAALEVRPAVVLSSPCLRALETARIAAEVLGLPAKAVVSTDALLPEADPPRLLALLRRRKEAELLCCGHAPQLDRVLAQALGVPETALAPLKKAGAAALELTRSRPPRARLLWLLEPAVLRRLGR